VSPVAAVPPDREPVEGGPVEFPAGLVCDFDLEIDSPDNRQVLRTFFDREGQPRATLITGSGPSLFTNLDTGESILIQGGGAVSLSEPGDGTFRIDSNGVAGFYFFPGDDTPAADVSGLFVIRGRGHTVLDLATNVVTSFSYTGSITDICAALEG
jgi:hypothetical protein